MATETIDDACAASASAPHRPQRPAAARMAGALFAAALLLATALAGVGCAEPETDDAASSDDGGAPPKLEVSDTPHEEDSDADAALSEEAAALQQRVQAAIDGVAAPYGDAVSVAYASVAYPGVSAGVNADVQRPSASMIKLAIMAAAYDAAARGELSFDEVLVMTADDIVAGTGVIAANGAGSSFTVGELVRFMIVDSDNTAANMITNRIGMDAVNAAIAERGLSGTSMGRLMMDEAARANGLDNVATAHDLATLLLEIAQGEAAGEVAATEQAGILREQHLDGGLAAGVPAGTVVGHKTGSIDAAEHDGGIIYADEAFVLVVMTDGLGADGSEAFISSVAAAVCAAQAGA